MDSHGYTWQQKCLLTFGSDLARAHIYKRSVVSFLYNAIFGLVEHSFGESNFIGE
jgi:hypothetical protein